MAQAQSGNTVSIHYTGRLDDGNVFDSSRERDPLKFELGSGQVIPGFEAAVMGMEVGEEVTTTIPAAEAYGPHRDELLIEVPKTQLPDEMDPQVGDVLEAAAGEQTTRVVVTELRDDTIVVDGNHPLAGKDLTFDIELVSVD